MKLRLRHCVGSEDNDDSSVGVQMYPVIIKSAAGSQHAFSCENLHAY